MEKSFYVITPHQRYFPAVKHGMLGYSSKIETDTTGSLIPDASYRMMDSIIFHNPSSPTCI